MIEIFFFGEKFKKKKKNSKLCYYVINIKIQNFK